MLDTRYFNNHDNESWMWGMNVSDDQVKYGYTNKNKWPCSTGTSYDRIYLENIETVQK